MKELEKAYKRAFDATLAAKSRTVSSMITGPARFPTARNQKRMETVMKRSEGQEQVLQRGIDNIKKQLRKTSEAEEGTELERAVKKLENLKSQHEKMKQANAILRKSITDEEKRSQLLGLFSEKIVDEIFK